MGVASLLLAGSLCSAGVPAPTLIARTGDPVPLPVGGEIIWIGTPGVSESEAVALGVASTAGGVNVMMRRAPTGGAFEPVAWSGLPLPGAGGEFYSLFFNLLFEGSRNEVDSSLSAISARGDMSFVSVVKVPDEFGFSQSVGMYWAPMGGVLERVWQRPDPVPGIDGLVFVNGGSFPFITEDGAHFGTLTYNNSAGHALFRYDDAGFEAIIDSNTRLPDGGRWFNHAWNARGEVAITSFSNVFVRSPSGVFTSLTPEGASVPGLDGAPFIPISDVGIGDDGTVAFVARLLVSDPGLGYDALLASVGGQLGVVARRGQPVPGIEGALFDPRLTAPLIGSEDGILFVSGLMNEDEEVFSGALFMHSGPSEYEPVLRFGGAAPGAGGGRFANLWLQDTAINARNDIAFLAPLVTGENGIEEGVNDRGLWVRGGEQGEVTLLVRRGDAVDVARPGEEEDLRIISEIHFVPTQSLANNGRLGYTLEFTDGTSAAFTTFVGELPSLCPADLDGDDAVDFRDFSVFVSRFDAVAGDPMYDQSADFDFDGDIDFGDFAFFVTQFDRDDCAN